MIRRLVGYCLMGMLWLIDQYVGSVCSSCSTDHVQASVACTFAAGQVTSVGKHGVSGPRKSR